MICFLYLFLFLKSKRWDLFDIYFNLTIEYSEYSENK